jgi:hypothetical protein
MATWGPDSQISRKMNDCKDLNPWIVQMARLRMFRFVTVDSGVW